LSSITTRTSSRSFFPLLGPPWALFETSVSPPPGKRPHRWTRINSARARRGMKRTSLTRLKNHKQRLRQLFFIPTDLFARHRWEIFTSAADRWGGRPHPEWPLFPFQRGIFFLFLFFFFLFFPDRASFASVNRFRKIPRLAFEHFSGCRIPATSLHSVKTPRRAPVAHHPTSPKPFYADDRLVRRLIKKIKNRPFQNFAETGSTGEFGNRSLAATAGPRNCR